MRGFVPSGRLPRMVRPTATTLAVMLAACNSPQYELWQEGQAKFASSGEVVSTGADATSGEPGTEAGEADATTGGESASTASTGTTTDVATPDTATDTGDESGTEDNPPVVDPDKPVIVSIDLPDDVYTAGPVPITVHTKFTGNVHLTRDDVDVGELIAAGDGLFTGELPVLGAIDNGTHTIEVIASAGPYEAREPDSFEVKAPMPGTEAWSQAGPAGSRTNRVAVTSDGYLLEAGQIEKDGVPQPTIRKRSSVDGDELWTVVLDTREGAAVDVAVLPDGRMWVAMNVREPMKDSQPRIALLDADGHATDVDVLGTAGRVVRGIAADASGGCFAVGVAGVMGDWDFAYWRIDAAGVPTLGDVYDYQPNVLPHEFRDLASDVVIDGDVAWVVGLSQGQHEDDFENYTRGVVVPMDLHTGEIVAPVIVAPMDGGWWHSAFFGGALHPDGLLVTGYGCDDTCDLYRIETSLYTATGERTWHETENANDGLAYGSDVVFDSQGRALVAGAVMQNGKLRGYVFGRAVGNNWLTGIEHWYPGIGPSEGLGIVRDSFDRIFPVGYLTVNGEPQDRITRIHG